MIKTSKISYRYLSNDTKVYCVGKLPKTSERSVDFVLYTAPFYSSERKETQNAIMAFKHDAVAEQTKKQADTESLYEVFAVDVSSLKYYSTVLQMPLVVELESNNENIDVYCHFPVKNLKDKYHTD